MKIAAKRRITFKFKLILLACFLVYVGFAIFLQQENIDRLYAKQEELNRQYAQVQQDLSRLQHQNEYMSTDNYIRNAARQKLGLAYPDEIILEP